MIVLDTSGLFAALDASERQHDAALAAVLAATGPRLLSPFILAELDYLLGTRVSHRAAAALLAEVSAGAYQLEQFDAADIAAASTHIGRYPDMNLGLADASILVLAARHGATDILTLDERHFRAVRDDAGRPFRILPADAA